MLEEQLSLFLLGKKLKLLTTRPFRGGNEWVVEWQGRPACCLKCGGLDLIQAGRCSTRVREEPVRQVPLWLKIRKHRYFCKTCKRTFTEAVDGIWPGRRTTQRFRQSVAQACASMTDLARVAEIYKASNGLIYKVFYERLAVKLNERKGQMRWPEVIGLDEHFFRREKGVTEFVSVFVDLKKRRLFEMAQGQDRKSLESQLAQIPGRENVKVVVIDMSPSYRSFVKKFFPNARIIADKFHVLRLLGSSIMSRGKKIHGHRQELKIRRKLLKNRTKLEYFERFEIDQYLKDHPELDEVYRWKERLFEFYRIKGFARAVSAHRKLTDAMSASTLPEIQRLRRTLLRWKNEILFYFEKGYTNALTERTNGTGKLVQRRAFGYRSFKNYRLRTLSACLFKNF